MRPLVAALLALAVAGCTAPGEPPASPSAADYHDLMNRETDKTTATIATMQLVVGELRRSGITQNYATVMTRQSVADLTSVATDLRQVTAPTAPLALRQRQLQRLLARILPTIASVSLTWDQPGRLAATAIHLSAAQRRAARLSLALA